MRALDNVVMKKRSILFVFLFMMSVTTISYAGPDDADDDSCCPWATRFVRVLALFSVAQSPGSGAYAYSNPPYGIAASPSSCHKALQDYYETGEPRQGGHHPVYYCGEVQYSTSMLRSDLNRHLHLMHRYLNEPASSVSDIQKEIHAVSAKLAKESCSWPGWGRELVALHAQDTAAKIRTYKPSKLMIVEGAFFDLRDDVLPVPQYYNPHYRDSSFPRQWLHYQYFAPKNAPDPTIYDPFGPFYKRK